VRRAEATTIDPQVPLLIFSGISAQAAAFATTATVAATGFSLLVHLALLAGLVVSVRNLRRRLPLDWLAYLVMVLALVAFNVRNDLAVTAALYPDAALHDANLVVAALLVWVLVGFGFVQYRRRNLIFISACGLAIFGLIGVINLEPGIFVAFLIYLFTTIMAWSYEALTARAAPGAAAMWWRVARGQATTGATVLAGVALGAFLTSSLLYFAIPSPFGVGVRAPRMWSWAGSLVQGNFLLNSRLAVGAGPAALGDQVLFRVRAEAPGLWRSSAYDHYDGHNWSRTLNGHRTVRCSAVNYFRLAAGPAPSARLNHQQYWVEAGTTGAVLAAAHPLEVRFESTLWGGRVSSVMVDDYGCLTSSPVTQPAGSFSVTSALPEDDPARLRAAGTTYPPWMRQMYIEDLPLATQTALQDLATQVTSGARTPYDKVVAVQTYLEGNYYYTEKEPVTPQDQDAAAFFLLNSKRGACDLFATSMAVLLRLSGVPARVATGFISGDYDPETGTNAIRAKDAHAWVEVYFPGYDWIPFNPAPQRDLDQASLWTLLKAGQSLYAVTQLAKAVGIGALVAALAALLVMAAVDPRLLQARLGELRSRRDPWERAAREARAAGVALLAALDLPAGPAGETPLEALGRVAGMLPGGTTAPAAGMSSALPHLDRLRALLADYYRLRYSPAPGDRAQVLAVARDLRDLRRRLRRRRR
jgi:transglutaminase-like putative cysteine protease